MTSLKSELVNEYDCKILLLATLSVFIILFQIDMVIPTTIQGILLQGWYDGQTPRLIKKFTLSYGVRKDQWKTYEDSPGIVKVSNLIFHVHCTISSGRSV